MRLSQMRIMFFAAILLAGCSGGDGKPLAQMTFAHLQPMPIYVASYDVLSNANFDKNNLPEGFVANPEDIIMDYLNHRFVPSGTNGKIIASIEKISVKHNLIASESKVGEFLGVDKRDEYDIEASVKLRLVGLESASVQEVSMKAQRQLLVSEHVSIVEREREQMEAIDHLVDDLDEAIQKAMRDHFHVF